MDSILIFLTLAFIAWLFLRIFWKGLVIFCRRHGKLGPFLYFVFLFPIAFFHILLTGFGDKEKTYSKKEIALNKKEAEKKLIIEIKNENKKIKEEAEKKLFIELKDDNWKITEKEKAWQEYLNQVENHILVTRVKEFKNKPKKSSRQLAKEKKKAWKEYFNSVLIADDEEYGGFDDSVDY
jgi:hypothetical protein